MVGARLMECAQRGDAAGVRALLAEADDQDLDHRDDQGWATLHWAAYFDEAAVVEALLADGRAELDARSARGATMLHVAAQQNALRVLRLVLGSAALSTRSPVARAPIDDLDPDWLEVAPSAGDCKDESTTRARLECRTEDDETALHLAAAAGHAPAVSVLVAAGADARATDRWGRTPRRVAREHGEVAATAALTALCDDGEGDADDDGESCATAASDRKRDATEVHAELTRALARRRGARAEAEPSAVAAADAAPPLTDPTSAAARAFGFGGGSSSGTPLRFPALSSLVEFPGDAADIAARLSSGEVEPAGHEPELGLTAAHKFAAWNRCDLLELLLPRLTDEELNAPARGKGAAGFTPLHSAADAGAARTFARLWGEPRAARMRASLDTKGRSALDLAVANGLAQPDGSALHPPPPPSAGAALAAPPPPPPSRAAPIASLAQLARRRLEEQEDDAAPVR